MERRQQRPTKRKEEEKTAKSWPSITEREMEGRAATGKEVETLTSDMTRSSITPGRRHVVKIRREGDKMKRGVCKRVKLQQ